MLSRAHIPCHWCASCLQSFFNYMAGSNVEHKDIIANGRTVPIVIRPQSTLATPSGWWLMSMMISTANYPDVGSIPLPLNDSSLYLEPLGLHTFATLDFNFTSQPPDYEPPYFTYFQVCV